VRRRRASWLFGLLATAGIVAGLALAPGPCAAADARLADRLDHDTAAAVDELIDQAHAKGLPTEPLVARALEGASRQAPGPRIVAAVKNLATALEAAREALGMHSSTPELVAGAAALSAGVHADTLARLRQVRPGSLVVPLVVLTDLVTRRVPAETASAAVLAATRARVRDRELMRLRERIGRDIGAGASPTNATVLRTRSLVRTFEPPTGVGTGPVPERKVGP